jgi:hypothetical protein
VTDGALELVEVSGTVYGVRVRGRLPATFRSYLLPATGTPAGAAGPAGAVELAYRTLDDLPEVEETWATEAEGPGGTVRLALFRTPGGFGLTVAGEGRGLYRCTPRRIDAEWAAPDPRQGTGAAHYLFTYALPLWLETEGVPVLHASAVAVGGRAVGFVGPSGVGKSVLCAELLRLGCGFVADDGLALRRGPGPGAWRAAPGPPLLRLWPSGLEGRLGVPASGLPRVHETLDKRRLELLGGAAEAAAPPPDGLPLAAVYSLRREPGGEARVEISPCRPRDALVQLLEHGVAAAPAAALGLSGRRLDLLAHLAETVPVRQLRFPSGADSAVRVLDAITTDLEG